MIGMTRGQLKKCLRDGYIYALSKRYNNYKVVSVHKTIQSAQQEQKGQLQLEFLEDYLFDYCSATYNDKIKYYNN